MAIKKLKPIKAKTYKEPGIKAKKYKEPKQKDEENLAEENLDAEIYVDEEDYDLDEFSTKKKAKKKRTPKKSKRGESDNSSKPKNKNILMKICNVLFIIIIIAAILICVDIVRVAKYKAKPIFAIKTNTYDDGGTKEYYGLGYKVLKYNVTNGRSDIQIGTWKLKYSITPVKVDILDLAIEFENDPEKTAHKYYNHYVEVSGKIKEINNDIREVIIEYPDPDKKYTLQLKCIMAKNVDIDNYMVDQTLTVRGIVGKSIPKDETKPNRIYIKDSTAQDDTVIPDNPSSGDVPGDLPDPNTLEK